MCSIARSVLLVTFCVEMVFSQHGYASGFFRLRQGDADAEENPAAHSKTLPKSWASIGFQRNRSALSAEQVKDLWQVDEKSPSHEVVVKYFDYDLVKTLNIESAEVWDLMRTCADAEASDADLTSRYMQRQAFCGNSKQQETEIRKKLASLHERVSQFYLSTSVSPLPGEDEKTNLASYKLPYAHPLFVQISLESLSKAHVFLQDAKMSGCADFNPAARPELKNEITAALKIMLVLWLSPQEKTDPWGLWYPTSLAAVAGSETGISFYLNDGKAFFNSDPRWIAIEFHSRFLAETTPEDVFSNPHRDGYALWFQHSDELVEQMRELSTHWGNL